MLSIALFVMMGIRATGQENLVGIDSKGQGLFDGILLEEEDERTVEVMKDILDLWIESPVNVNSDQASIMAEYGLISEYQWNRLREYRLMYGDLLSIYELKNIAGWDLQTAQRVEPYLATAGQSDVITYYSLPSKPVQQELVFRASVSPQIRIGYEKIMVGDTLSQSHYSGSPFRLGLRYDLLVGRSIQFGIRSEKDAGEPYLVKNEFFNGSYHGPDYLSAFLQFNFKGPIKTLLLGDFRLVFGYGLNYSGGNRMFGNRDGLTQPSNRLHPNTSMSESGYLRGIAAHFRKGRFSLTGFASRINFDGTSMETDSITGNALSFSAINISGLHRTQNELEHRKKLSEEVFGGTISFGNNWMKAGVICYFNHFDQLVKARTDPYAIYDFHGTSNLIAGMTLSALLKGIRVISEFSISKNGGFALIAGSETVPCKGVNISMIFRYYDLQYQNMHGTGYSSSGNNNNETGFQTIFRFETPWWWIIRLVSDASGSRWVSYQLNAPSSEWYAMLSAEKAWRDKGTLFISARYREKTVADAQLTKWIVHPGTESRISFRLEGRLRASKSFTLKSRVEWNTVMFPGMRGEQGFLIFQDISYTPERIPLHFWVRIGLFESDSYESRLYAQENDVMYDFSSFQHYGKGLRNVWMIRYSPWKWLDCWMRLASVIYSDRAYTGSDWDRAEGNRLDEVEVQVRMKLQHQYNFSRFKR